VFNERERANLYGEVKKLYEYTRQMHEQLNFALEQNQKVLDELTAKIAEMGK
jgi:hypothetical protein